jgi:hydroxypyruvate isomerase
VKFAANLSLLFCELPLLDRFAAAREAGFDTVEVQFPYVEPVERVDQARRAAGVEVVLINAPVCAGHPAGFAGRPELEAEFQAVLPQVAEYAAALGARYVNVLAGLAEPGAAEAGRAVFARNLSAAADALAPVGAIPLVEALNPVDVPGCLVGDLDAARDVLARCAGRAGFLFDLYHAAMMGRSPVEALDQMAGHVRHVQFADAPGRHQPGTGAAPIEAVLEALVASGYRGWVSAEYRPQGATLDSLGWLPGWRARFGA